MIGIKPKAKGMRAKGIDDLRWPYAISPLKAYMFGVFTVWMIFILHHFFMYAIFAAKKRMQHRRRGRGKKRSPTSTHRHHHQRPITNQSSLHTAQSTRQLARIAEVPASSPYNYRPSKFSAVKVRRKLAKKIRGRTASRQQRKSCREFLSAMKFKKKPLLPTSPTYELFQYMNSQPLSKDGASTTYSFVHRTREISDPQSKFFPKDNVIAEESTQNQELYKEMVKNVGKEEISINEEARFLTVLVSTGVCEYTQKARQNETLDLLRDLRIPHKEINGMDPLQRDQRDYFFGVSGIRGNYPQIFCSSDGDKHEYLGGYDWIQSMTFEGLRKIVT